VASTGYRTRTLRGAVSGTVAAAIWAVAQPLDKLAFGGDYDDVELLGKALVRGEGWYPAGLALHLSRGAVLGAAYANLAPVLPLPAFARGPAFGLGDNLVWWPLGLLSDRLPRSSRNSAATARRSRSVRFAA
jgi:hypothetical protein